MGIIRVWLLWNILMILLSMAVSQSVQGLRKYNPESLHSLLHSYAYRSLVKSPKTGALYRIPLPSNFSGMEASIIRIRRRRFWERGVYFSNIRIPPRVLLVPSVRRLDVVYENLGNWSSHYYKVPGHSLATPVVGFTAYNASFSGPRGSVKLNLSFTGDPISIRFRYPRLRKRNETVKCATFGPHGSVQLTNMTKPNLCLAKVQGHFALVIPSSKPKPRGIWKKRREKFWWKWWVIGVGGGLGGLLLVGLIGMVIFKMVRRRNLAEMERMSEQGVTLDTIWIGSNKLPSAAVVRTQPALENEHVP